MARENKHKIIIEGEDRSAAKTLRAVAREIDKTATAAAASEKELRKTADALRRGEEDAKGFGLSLGKHAALALAAVGASAALATTSLLTAAGDFQQGMSVFREVSGATSKQMDAVQARAQQLAADITLPGVSARVAADAMIELSKAGLSVNDTLAASKGVLSLAKAGQLGAAQAAAITANALLAFNLHGKEASRVADLLAAAANASSADVADMGMSLSQVSALAAQTKRPIEDVVTQIALLANKGIKGSDAGTSLKTMLLALSAPSSAAATEMDRLGLRIYDAEGRMRSSREIIEQLTRATATMTDQQRDAALATLFGSDAVRAASILVGGGVEAYDKMAQSVGKAGAAQKLAAAYTSGLNGNIEAIKGSVENFALAVGLKLLPAAENATGALARNLGPALDAIMTGAGRVADKVGDYLGPKLSELWHTLNSDLIPAVADLWHNYLAPLAPVVGTTLVVAIGAAVDVANGLAGAAAWLITELNNGNPAVWALAGAFGGLAAAMAINGAINAVRLGMATLTLITIPSLAASLGTLSAIIAAPMVMPAIAIGAALAALAAVAAKAMETGNVVKDVANRLGDTKREGDKTDAAIRKLHDEGKISTDKLNTYLRNTENAAKHTQTQLYSGFFGPVNKALDNLFVKITGTQEQYKGTGFGGYATGTAFARGGATLVGENGPEIVDLPAGAAVTPSYRTQPLLTQRATMPGQSVTIGQVVVNNTTDWKAAMRMIGFRIGAAG